MKRNEPFLKLELRLLNDHRWFMMSPSAQLLYVKLLLMGGVTGNWIPSDPIVISRCTRSKHIGRDIVDIIKEIQSGNSFSFDSWKSRNYCNSRLFSRII